MRAGAYRMQWYKIIEKLYALYVSGTAGYAKQISRKFMSNKSTNESSPS